VLLSEQELAIQIRKVDGIEVDNVNLSEASKGDILEQFASDATCANHQNTSL
jgi:hypothetical protein